MKWLMIPFMLSIGAVGWSEEEPPVAIHYKKASALREQGKPAAAIEEAGKGIALNPQEKEWLAKSELLSARLYVELGMLESAEVTARQIILLYKDTEFETEARRLQEKIERLTEEAAVEAEGERGRKQ